MFILSNTYTVQIQILYYIIHRLPFQCSPSKKEKKNENINSREEGTRLPCCNFLRLGFSFPFTFNSIQFHSLLFSASFGNSIQNYKLPFVWFHSFIDFSIWECHTLISSSTSSSAILVLLSLSLSQIRFCFLFFEFRSQ